MTALLASLALLMAGAAVSGLGRGGRAAVLGWLAAVGGCLPATAVALHDLLAGAAREAVVPCRLPFGPLRLGMDPLSALFVFLIGLIGALAALYGRSYLQGQPARKTARSWCWYNLLLTSMLLVVLARNAFVFLVAWEVMSLTSFFLVMHDHEKAGVMRAGWIYLIATHLGTAFLLVMFLLLARGPDLDFAAFSAHGATASAVFAAALIGFGTKAGLVPLHVWLPEAHPAAPSHVSALMSGVMIKIGLYGLLRTLLFLGPPPAWWGWTLLAAGLLSALSGVLSALSQHDLKRLLAYHSVENIGIIAMGAGMGLLGLHFQHPLVAALGFCGAALHILNHGIFKSLLFMGAGSVLHATGTAELDRLGGLLKPMPVTGASFLMGSAAISGLPPLNGFVSEFLVYAAGFAAMLDSQGAAWSGLVIVGGLALTGGLAAACFVKAFGIVFLGSPRSAAALQAREAPRPMLACMAAAALLCIAIGLGAPGMVRMIWPVTSVLMATHHPALLAEVDRLVTWIAPCALTFIAGAVLLLVIRAALLRGRSVRREVTWDCGYAAPSARMQYTASSFAQPILTMFAPILRPRCQVHAPQGAFPASGDLHTETPDVFVRLLFHPALLALRRLALAFGGLQQGRTHQSVVYIVATILLLLIWNLGW